jgi:flagellar biogenesis protein FliO
MLTLREYLFQLIVLLLLILALAYTLPRVSREISARMMETVTKQVKPSL